MSYRNQVARISASLVIILALFSSPLKLEAQSPRCDRTTAACTPPPDVAVGEPMFTSYSRIFPLLSGMLQDFSAIQVSPLTVSANGANAAQLDAVIQQFALSVQYNQTLGLQNSLAASQTAVQNQTNQQQSSLLNQQTQWLSIDSADQAALTAAQNAQANLPSTASQADKDAATAQVTVAQDNLNAATAQLAVIKAALPGASSGQAFKPVYDGSTSPAAPTIQTPKIDPALPSLSPDGKTAVAPTFPPLKQITNQTQLLWERLVQMVRMLSLDSQRQGEQVYLAEFHTAPLEGSSDHKHQLLTTEYKLSCGVDATTQPRVIDLYPRNAAVNIANEKYKDSRFGIAAIVSFFSIGLNAAYNREHMQISQALTESAYITGYGIQRSDFGWVFGPSLGDDNLAAGDRETFALFALPTSCGTPKIALVNASWNKRPAALDPIANNVDLAKLTTGYAWSVPSLASLNMQGTDGLQSVSYSTADVDVPSPGTSPTSPMATINLVLGADRRIDSEANLFVNGVALPRYRDSFLRATAPPTSGGTAPGTGGVLDTTTKTDSSWLPISNSELSVSLVAPLFTSAFPSIRLDSPSGSIDLTDDIDAETSISVSGRTLKCPSTASQPCGQILPPVGRLRPTSRSLLVSRWTDKGTQKLLLVLDQPLQQAQTNSTTPTAQVITSSTRQTWSADAHVLAVQGGRAVYLNCETLGERLSCGTSNLAAPDFLPNNETRLEVYDPAYLSPPATSGGTSIAGAIFASKVLPACSGSACTMAGYVWSLRDPKWDDASIGWRLHLELIQVATSDKVQLGDLDQAKAVPVICRPATSICEATIQIALTDFARTRDTMTLHVIHADTTVTDVDRIANIHTLISPLIQTISSDQTQFTGTNLVYPQISIGSDGTPMNVNCVWQSSCFLKTFTNDTDGYLYFVPSTGSRIPFVKLVSGVITPIDAHHPAVKGPNPSPAGSGAGGATPPASGSAGTPPASPAPAAAVAGAPPAAAAAPVHAIATF